MAGYDSFLELERAFQRLTTLEFDTLEEAPGPVYDMADDLEAVMGGEQAAALAAFLNQRMDDWEEGR